MLTRLAPALGFEPSTFSLTARPHRLDGPTGMEGVLPTELLSIGTPAGLLRTSIVTCTWSPAFGARVQVVRALPSGVFVAVLAGTEVTPVQDQSVRAVDRQHAAHHPPPSAISMRYIDASFRVAGTPCGYPMWTIWVLPDRPHVLLGVPDRPHVHGLST